MCSFNYRVLMMTGSLWLMYRLDIMVNSFRTSDITSESCFFISPKSSFKSYKSGTSVNVYIKNFVVAIKDRRN